MTDATIDVRSEVAGRVFRIEAEVGSAVAAQDVIVVVESMKMEVPIEAPRAGTLAEMLVAEGDAVAEDQVVARLRSGRTAPARSGSPTTQEHEA